MADFIVVEDRVTKEVERATSWLRENHADIQTNFDPSVVRFRKKHKIIISEGALEDLIVGGAGDEPQ